MESIITLDMRQSKTLRLSTNVDQNALETDKWQSKTMFWRFLSAFVDYSERFRLPPIRFDNVTELDGITENASVTFYAIYCYPICCLC